MIVQIKRFQDGSPIPAKHFMRVNGVQFRDAETGDIITEKRVSGDVDTRRLQLKKAAKRLGVVKRHYSSPGWTWGNYVLFQLGGELLETEVLWVRVTPFRGYSNEVRDCVIFTHASKDEIDAAWYQPRARPRAPHAGACTVRGFKVSITDAESGTRWAALVRGFRPNDIGRELASVAYRFFGTDILVELTEKSDRSAIGRILRPVFDTNGEWTRKWRVDRVARFDWEAA